MTSPTNRESEPKRVLLLSDSPYRRHVSRALGFAGFLVNGTVTDGAISSLAKPDRFAIDAIVLDLGRDASLPDQIRRLDPTTPLLVIADADHGITQQMCDELGAMSVLFKDGNGGGVQLEEVIDWIKQTPPAQKRPVSSTTPSSQLKTKIVVITHNGRMPKDGGKRLGYMVGDKVFPLPGITITLLRPEASARV